MGLAVAVVLAALAFGLPVPEGPGGPQFVGPQPPTVGASAIGSVWYCPWLDSGDIRDSSFLMASVPPTDVRITLPSPIPNEEPLEDTVSISGPGSRVLNVADVVRIGAAPGFVEFDDGPAAAAAAVDVRHLARGRSVHPVVAEDLVPPWWNDPSGSQPLSPIVQPFLGAGQGDGERRERVRPFAAPGPGRGDRCAGAGLGRCRFVAYRFRFLDDLLLIVGSEEGLIIPALSLMADQGDEATWPGTGLSTTWEFSGRDHR